MNTNVKNLNEYSDDEIRDEFNRRNLKTKGDYILEIEHSTPGYGTMNDQLVKYCGSFQGGPGDRWNWKLDRLYKLNIEGLSHLSDVLKNS